MIELNHEEVIGYLLRSYRAVDGLWFLKVEEKYGFDIALEIDNEAWKVMPKIQAHMIKSLLKVSEGTDALLKSLISKLDLEGFNFKTEKKQNGFRIIISNCPWHNLMVKSGRDNLSGTVGSTICNTEYSVWASQFDEKLRFTLEAQICRGSDCCILEFRR